MSGIVLKSSRYCGDLEMGQTGYNAYNGYTDEDAGYKTDHGGQDIGPESWQNNGSPSDLENGVSNQSYINEIPINDQNPNKLILDKTEIPTNKNERNSEAQFQDEEHENKFINRLQQMIRGWLKEKEHIVIGVIKVIMVLLYFVYFTYAMYYERLRGEASIRLLWVTCVVVFFVLLRVIRRFYGSRITRYMEPCVEKLSAHENHVSWFLIAAIFLVVIVFVFVDVFTNTKQYYNLVSGAGILIFVFLFCIFSVNPAKIQWRAVVWGIGLQFVFAVIILRWPTGYQVFAWLGDRITIFLKYADAGAKFLFGPEIHQHFFVFSVSPVIVFFSAITSVLYYLGVMQVIIQEITKVMQFAMGTTAGESFNAAANIFLAMTDVPLMIRPLLQEMTKSELHAVMTGGFATIAGSVLAAYIGFGVPANHLLSASVMSAPAALAMAKLLYPETEKSKTTTKDIKKLYKSPHVNILAAATDGATRSIKIIANILVNLIAFISIFYFLDQTLIWFGNRAGLYETPLTFKLICSYLLWPVSVIMGVPISDCRSVAKLIGVKTFLNEFVAFVDLGGLIDNRQVLLNHVASNGSWAWKGDNIILHPLPGHNNTDILENGFLTVRSEVIATYALCGFANIGSIGVQLGTIGAMIPHRKQELAGFVVRAMIAGNVACFLTACIAGLFYQDE